MSPLAVLCLQSAILVGLPYFIWNYLKARSIAPLAVVQVVCGLALGPSFSAGFRHRCTRPYLARLA
jgi:hypothetical protein